MKLKHFIIIISILAVIVVLHSLYFYNYPCTTIDFESAKNAKEMTELYELNEYVYRYKYLYFDKLFDVLGAVGGVLLLSYTIYYGFLSFEDQKASREKEHITNLLTLLYDSDRGKRIGAMTSLVKYRDKGIIQDLVEKIKTEDCNDVILILESALHDLDDDNFNCLLRINHKYFRERVEHMGRLKEINSSSEDIAKKIGYTNFLVMKLNRLYKDNIRLSERYYHYFASDNIMDLVDKNLRISSFTSRIIAENFYKYSNTFRMLDEYDLSNAYYPDFELYNAVVKCTMFSNSKFRKLSLRKVEFNVCGWNDTATYSSRLESITFTDCDLSNLKLRKASLNDIKMNSCSLNGASFSETEIDKLVINNSDANNEVKFNGANITEAEFISSKFNGSEFKGAVIKNMQCSDSEFYKSFINSSSFDKCLFTQVKFSGSTIKNTNFVNCRFSDVDFSGVDFYHTSFENCMFMNIRYKNTKNIDSSIFSMSGGQ